MQNCTFVIQSYAMSGLAADFKDFPKGLPSLKELAACVVVYNDTLLHFVDNLSSKLKEYLMTIAVEDYEPFAIISLLRSWADERLCVQLPVLHRMWEMFEKECLEATFSDGITVILENFIQPKSCLKYLDVSAFPLTESQVSLLCSLATSENLESSDPNFVIYVNCSLLTKEVLEQLISIHEAEKIGQSRFKVIVRALHLPSVVCCDQLSVLLRYLDPRELKEFSCTDWQQYITLVNVPKIMDDFQSLEVLSFKNCDSPHILKPLLDQSMNLECLSIQCSSIRDSLEYLLSGTFQIGSVSDAATSAFSSKLKFLDLSGCIIDDSSVLYLASSPHAQTLSTLNLNTMPERLKLSSIISLLQACENLRVFQIEDCKFKAKKLNRLFEFLPSMEKLRFLNIAVDLSPDYMFKVVPLLCAIPSLVDLQVKFPTKEKYPRSRYSFSRFGGKYCDLVESAAPSREINVYIV